MVGVLSARTVAETLADGEHDRTAAGDAAEATPTLRADQSLDEALEVLDRSELPGIPVLDPDDATPVGWMSHRQVLTVLRRGGHARG